MAPPTSAQFSLTLRVRIDHRPGMLGRVATAIGEAGGTIGDIELVDRNALHTLRDLTVDAGDEAHERGIVEAVRAVDGAEVVDWSDRTLGMHVGGKLEVALKHPLRTQDDLSMAYTPGVARVCTAIAEDPGKAFQYTIKRNTVAVVTDGSAVLGLGDIGPEASLPVMEGKAMLFKEFAGVDAFPLCLGTKDTDAIVDTVRAIAPGFGGINLEDISAPRCFEIETRLKAELPIPVFHDDQHGTAVVTLAALLNACKLTGRRIGDVRAVIVGVGAAGVAVAKILVEAGVGDVIGCDSRGALHRGREDYERLPPMKRWLADMTNREGRAGPPAAVIEGADLFVGLSGPGAMPVAALGCDGAGGDGLRDGQPDAGGHARGGCAVRARHRDGPLGLPEPDQQRALLPRHLPRRARRARARDHRGDEDGRRARDRRDRRRRRAERALRHPVPVQPGRGPGRRRRGRPRGARQRRGRRRGRLVRLRRRRHLGVPGDPDLTRAPYRL